MASGGVFGLGKYKTELINIESSSTATKPPPKPGTPSEAGDFPVLLFLHGYLFRNSFYSQLILHVASHGFIVVPPQLYTLTGRDAAEEIKSTAKVTNWLPEGLQFFLPSQVRPDLEKLALAGHNRGGKVAFALALGKTAAATTNLKFSAIIGVDPVDGKAKGKLQSPPPVLTYVPASFDLDMAAMVIGSGLGEVKRNLVSCPCAPKGVNHEEFYRECGAPACYMVAKDYGHCDMLDDNTEGIVGKVSYCLCKNGKARKPMREFVGGALVAFLRGYLQSALMAIFDKTETAPVQLQASDFRE